MSASVKYRCKECHKNIAATGQSPSPLRYRKHDREKGTECPNSRTIIPAWIVKRGPEQEDSDVPVIGRDYAPCPDCKRSPLLDDEGRYAEHIKDAGVPSAERVDCPMSGQPYAPEGEECTTSTAAGPSPATTPQAPAQAATSQAPTQDAATAPPDPEWTEAEEMISKWAAKAREIEDRSLPETEPSPVSTPTPQALPPRPDAPEAPPSAASSTSQTPTESTAAGTPTPKPVPMDGSSGAAPSTDATAAPTSPTKSSGTGTGTPPDVQALASLFPRSVRTPDGTAASAGPTPAAVLEAATREVQKVMPGATVEYDSTPIPFLKDAPTPTPDAAPSTAATLPTPADALPSSSPFVQPGSPFSQPAKVSAAVTDPIPMTVLAEQVAARMKELFFNYDNRNTSDNRSAQSTLGPSEIGTPCDRRLALSLLQVEPVNPGGDGWAAFVGTAIHSALAEMFVWASGDTGRFAVETPLTFPNEHVPKGTADLLDRTLCMVDDHKAMGRWSLDKLKTRGIPPTYRVQLHTYGYGQRLKGEVVDYVALISWPREASSLADLYVVVEPYDPQIARDALARVDRIADQAFSRGVGPFSKLEVAKEFDIDPESCRYCPFHAPGDAEGTRGCNGRA